MDKPDNQLKSVLDQLPELVSFLDTNLRYEYANMNHSSWFGIDPSSINKQHISEIIGKDAFKILRSHLEDALSGKESTFTGEIPFVNKNIRYSRIRCAPLYFNNNNIDGVLFLASDWSEYKLIEETLDSTTLRNQVILDTAVDGIVIIDERGIVQSCNPSLLKQFGYNEEDLVGQNVTKLMPYPHSEKHDDYLQQYLESGEKHIIGIGREVTGKRKDGTTIPIELSVGEFMENGRHFFTGFTRDITDRKNAEYEVRKRQNELAHIGRLNTNHNFATTISHEINQPLTAIVTMTQALLRSQSTGKINPEMLKTTLEKIVRQSARASTIIQQMREFYGKGNSGSREPNIIDSIIKDVLVLLNHEIVLNNINVELSLNTGQTLINCNRVQIEQVILNLIQNSIDAMSNVGGERILKITTSNPRKESPYLEVSFEDNGHGLPDDPEIIFDSFYTTKKNGMGQGLSICKTIIEAHGGTINARQKNTQGSIFSFILPLPIEPSSHDA